MRSLNGDFDMQLTGQSKAAGRPASHPKPFVSLAALLLLLLFIGQALTVDRPRTATLLAPPPAIRERFETIRSLVRPGAPNQPVVFEKVQQFTRSGEEAREAWIADWQPATADAAFKGTDKVADDETSGLRTMLDAQTGQVLQVGSEGWTARRVASAEGEEEGAIKTSEEAVRTARRYLRGFGEQSVALAPTAAFTVQHRSKPAYPLESWRLTAHSHSSQGEGEIGEAGIEMILDARTGALIHYRNIAPPKA
jgi:hypothetical protein